MFRVVKSQIVWYRVGQASGGEPSKTWEKEKMQIVIIFSFFLNAFLTCLFGKESSLLRVDKNRCCIWHVKGEVIAFMLSFENVFSTDCLSVTLSLVLIFKKKRKSSDEVNFATDTQKLPLNRQTYPCCP